MTFTVDDRARRRARRRHGDDRRADPARRSVPQPRPRHRRQGRSSSPATSVRALPSVDFDEAFDFLDARGRRHVGSISRRSTRPPPRDQSGRELNVTVGELERTVAEVRDLTDALPGPGGRDRRVRRRHLDRASASSATASRRCAGSSAPGARRSPRSRPTRTRSSRGSPSCPACSTGRRGPARRAAAAARGAAAGRRGARGRARPRAGARRHRAARLRHGPRPSRTSPACRRCASCCALVILGGPTVPGLEASVRNLVPLLSLRGPAAQGHRLVLLQLRGVTAHGDSDGAWARFAIMFEPGEVIDEPAPATCYPEDDVPVEHRRLPQRLPGARRRGRPGALRARLVPAPEAVQAAAPAAVGVRLASRVGNLPIRV